MTYENLKAIKRWSLPDSYGGAHWDEYFVFLGQSRDSSALERSNFECGLEALGGESDTVQVVRESHWAVGWVEWIAIHQNDSEALEAADEMLCALSDYPILNESHFSELELSEAESYWASLRLSERVELCQQAGVSVFSARHDWLPSSDSGYIYEHCLGY